MCSSLTTCRKQNEGTTSQEAESCNLRSQKICTEEAQASASHMFSFLKTTRAAQESQESVGLSPIAVQTEWYHSSRILLLSATQGMSHHVCPETQGVLETNRWRGPRPNSRPAPYRLVFFLKKNCPRFSRLSREAGKQLWLLVEAPNDFVRQEHVVLHRRKRLLPKLVFVRSRDLHPQT